MKGQIEVFKNKDYAACPICGNAGKHREDCYVSRSLKAQASGEYALLAEVRADLLHEAVGLLMNYEQRCEMDWIEDYEELIAKYNEHFS